MIWSCLYVYRLFLKTTRRRYIQTGYVFDHLKDLRTYFWSSDFLFFQLTCAVCLEDFRTKDELGVLPCQHAFHKRSFTQTPIVMIIPHLNTRTPLSFFEIFYECKCVGFSPSVAGVWWSGWRWDARVPCVTIPSARLWVKHEAQKTYWMNYFKKNTAYRTLRRSLFNMKDFAVWKSYNPKQMLPI